jgi:hypothetical protein
MKRCHLLALSAVLSAAVAAPAMAAWDRIGSVDFSPRNNHDTQYGNFGGSVEALALQARNSDVRCSSVIATFGNGRTRQVFRGELPRGQNVTVDLPGRERLVKRLDFDCRSSSQRGATVDIAADVGRYKNEWRQSPDWQRTWSRMFHWDGNNSGDRNENNLNKKNQDRGHS